VEQFKNNELIEATEFNADGKTTDVKLAQDLKVPIKLPRAVMLVGRVIEDSVLQPLHIFNILSKLFWALFGRTTVRRFGLSVNVLLKEEIV
jgi:hypothetical protein